MQVNVHKYPLGLTAKLPYNQTGACSNVCGGKLPTYLYIFVIITSLQRQIGQETLLNSHQRYCYKKYPTSNKNPIFPIIYSNYICWFKWYLTIYYLERPTGPLILLERAKTDLSCRSSLLSLLFLMKPPCSCSCMYIHKLMKGLEKEQRIFFREEGRQVIQ